MVELPFCAAITSMVMRIAVLADTHNHCPPGLVEHWRDADEIWHLGDVCAPETLVEIEHLGRPLRVVRGNCDDHPGWPSVLDLELAGRRFQLTHIPPPFASAGVQFLLHGHTHVPRDEVIAGVRWLNPGSLTRPRGGPASYAWLELVPGRPVRWKQVRV